MWLFLLLYTVKAPNFDSGSKLQQGVSKKLKNCRNLKAQDRHPLSKAFKSAIFFEMQKKLKMVVTLYFVHFSLCWF
jgi:hypothetical protein